MDLYSYDPANGPAVPDLPPISIGALTIGLGDLFGRANGLVLPRTVVINETAQEYMLVFAPDPDSARVITSWAIRFGGVVESHVCERARHAAPARLPDLRVLRRPGRRLHLHPGHLDRHHRYQTQVPGLGDGHPPARPARKSP